MHSELRPVQVIPGDGWHAALALKAYLETPNTERLMYLTRAVLTARGIETTDWEPHVGAVKEAADHPSNHPLDCECEECV